MKPILILLTLLSLTLTAWGQGITVSTPQTWTVNGTNISRPFGDITVTNSPLVFANDSTNGNWRLYSRYNIAPATNDQVFELAYNVFFSPYLPGDGLSTPDRAGLGGLRWTWESLWNGTLEHYWAFYAPGSTAGYRVMSLTHDWTSAYDTWGFSTTQDSSFSFGSSGMMFIVNDSNVPYQGGVTVTNRGAATFLELQSGSAEANSRRWGWFINENSWGDICLKRSSGNTTSAKAGSTIIEVDYLGRIGLGTASPSDTLDVASEQFRLRSSFTVTNSTDPGLPGEIRSDTNYLYRCYATNLWGRIAWVTNAWP